MHGTNGKSDNFLEEMFLLSRGIKKTMVDYNDHEETKNEMQIYKADMLDTKKSIASLMTNAMKVEIELSRINRNIKDVNDKTQTNTDVINLFNDIDKNRTNLEDKLNNLEQSTNNRLDKLGASINQLISMLQKS